MTVAEKLPKLKQQILDEAEWLCKHCGQIFDSFEEARDHESSEHHIVGYIDVLDLKIILDGLAEALEKRFNDLDSTSDVYNEQLELIVMELLEALK